MGKSKYPAVGTTNHLDIQADFNLNIHVLLSCPIYLYHAGYLSSVKSNTRISSSCQYSTQCVNPFVSFIRGNGKVDFNGYGPDVQKLH